MTNPVLRKGDVSDDVMVLQNLLIAQGYNIGNDGKFGQKTFDAVFAFQKAKGLDADGVVGKDTWTALAVGVPIPSSVKITEADLIQAAESLNVEVKALKAVNKVESPKGGFLPDGRPTILFERHIMRRQLLAKGINVLPYETQFPNIVNENTGGYKGNELEYDRLAIAKRIDENSALEACSWGAYQIMGMHWKLLGYTSVQEMVKDFSSGEKGQLNAFVRFIRSQPSILKALRAKDWRSFARWYNGPGAIDEYSTKFEKEYNKLS